MEKTNNEINEQLLKLAKRRVFLKKMMSWHIIIYLIINVFLVGIFYLTTPDGYFWPIWSIVGWGLGLIIHIVVINSSLSSARNQQDAVEREYQMLQKDLKQNND